MTRRLVDTDILIHLRVADSAVVRAAETAIAQSPHSCHAGFSLVELKGNYISYLILLADKVAKSGSLRDAAARANNSGGRRARLMFAQLMRHLDLLSGNGPLPNWPQLQSLLLTHLDSEIVIAWATLTHLCSERIDALHCTRATEAPVYRNGGWTARIPRCTRANTTCSIDQVFQRHRSRLQDLLTMYGTADGAARSDELSRHVAAAREYIRTNNVPWEGTFCRSIGDLLVALETCGANAELLSSNHREHRFLSRALGYTYIQFPYAAIRLK